MNAQRRDTDREPAESAERIWQLYADQIGIPRTEPETGESLSQHRDDPVPGRRPVRVMAAGRLLATVAAVVVAVTAGLALWPEPSPSPDPASRPSPTQTSAPAGDAASIAQRSAPGRQTGDGLQAMAPAASTPVAPPMKAAPPSSAVSRPDTTETSGTYRVTFDFGSDGIDDESKRTLDRIVVAMKANPDWRMAIEGHTDARGTPDYNRALSERRAHAARTYLQSAGIAPRRLSAVGFGASRPLAPNDARGNVLNRRVELHRR